MDVEGLRTLLTDKGGWVAALAVVLALAGSFLGLVRPWLQRRRERLEGEARLQFANVRCTDPPPWSEAGKASFEIINVGGGRAVMTELRVTVLACGACDEPKMVEAAAPVPVFTYKVMLLPEVAQYDVRQREFGSEPPHAFDKLEVESFVVELRSKRPQWYELAFGARWYDARHPDRVAETRSTPVRIEFRPDAADLLR